MPGVALHPFAQPPVQGTLQQYPLTQFPLVHEDAEEHMRPLGSVERHDEPPLLQ